MKTTKEMIEVMQAYENGAEIEYFDPDDPNFKPLTEPLWNWLDFDYRVKPKPREWLIGDPDINEYVKHFPVDHERNESTGFDKLIKVREVMDDE